MKSKYIFSLITFNSFWEINNLVDYVVYQKLSMKNGGETVKFVYK